MMTLEPSVGLVPDPSSYVAGSPVRISLSLAPEVAWPESGQDSGQKCLESSERQSPLGSSLRTFLLFALEGQTRSSLIWKKQTTPQSRLWWVLGQSEQSTRDRGCGLLPTPTAFDSKKGLLTGLMVFRSDKHGLPRKVNKDGSEWSAGLNRLFELATGQNPLPRFWEWMMGFPLGWTALPLLETPSCLKSQNS